MLGMQWICGSTWRNVTHQQAYEKLSLSGTASGSSSVSSDQQMIYLVFDQKQPYP